MLQKNLITGFCFLLGIALNSWVFALAALASVALSNLMIWPFKEFRKDMEDGLWGFNACLIGIALVVFFEWSFELWLFAALALAIGNVLMWILQRLRIPPLTFPFVLTTWLSLYLFPSLGLETASTAIVNETTQLPLLTSLFKGIAQVFLQDNIWTGSLFLLGLAIQSRKVALYTLLASSFGVGIGYLLSLPMNWVNTGALGFSAVLTAILFSSSTYKWYEALASTLLTIAISIAFLRLDGIMLTAPFVFASWFVIGTKKLAAGK